MELLPKIRGMLERALGIIHVSPEVRDEFERQFLKQTSSGIRIMAILAFLGIFIATAARILSTPWAELSLPAIALQVVIEFNLAGIYLFTYSKNFVRIYKRLTAYFYYSQLVLVFCVAFVASPGGQVAAAEGLMVMIFPAILLPLPAIFRVLTLFCAYFALSALRIHLEMAQPLVEVGKAAATIGGTSLCTILLDRLLVESYQAKKRYERLLQNIYPGPVYERVKDQEEPSFVEAFSDVSILFADIVGFTEFSGKRDAAGVVAILNEIMSRLDASCSQIGAVKIKTIGDAYMAVTGMDGNPEHVHQIAELALDFRESIRKYSALNSLNLELRIGAHCGPVAAGIIGRTTSHFDLWGDSVNTAARLESSGLPGKIQISEQLAARIKDRYECTSRGRIELKGKGATSAFVLDRPKAA